MGEAGPSREQEEHSDQLNQMCEILSTMGMSREDLKRKGSELNWDQQSINNFIETQLQNRYIICGI
jgi:hypothetical protein